MPRLSAHPSDVSPLIADSFLHGYNELILVLRPWALDYPGVQMVTPALPALQTPVRVSNGVGSRQSSVYGGNLSMCFKHTDANGHKRTLTLMYVVFSRLASRALL